MVSSLSMQDSSLNHLFQNKIFYQLRYITESLESTQYLTFPHGEYIDIDYKFNGKKKIDCKIWGFLLLTKKKKKNSSRHQFDG